MCSQVFKPNNQWVSGTAHPEILTLGAPLLRQIAKPVTDIDGSLVYCEKLVTLLRELNGAGLAAPQAGMSIRLFIVEVRKTELFPDRPESTLHVMFNPEITYKSSEVEEEWEGCFSVPGLIGKVARAKSVEVSYSTPDGLQHNERFHGYIARVIQHEFDHLEGMVFLDRMSSMRNLMTVANYKEFVLNNKSKA